MRLGNLQLRPLAYRGVLCKLLATFALPSLYPGVIDLRWLFPPNGNRIDLKPQRFEETMKVWTSPRDLALMIFCFDRVGTPVGESTLAVLLPRMTRLKVVTERTACRTDPSVLFYNHLRQKWLIGISCSGAIRKVSSVQEKGKTVHRCGTKTECLFCLEDW